jgi:sortase A
MGKKRLLRFFERFFLIAGLLVLGFYVSTKLYSYLYQKYTSYTFNRQLSRQPPSIKGFDEKELLRRMIHAPQIIPDDGKEWENSRLSKYKKSGIPTAGSVLGRLEIPSVSLSVMLLQGTDEWTLNRAVGHIEGTPLPGQPGNLGTGGPRDGFFRCLKDIKQNSSITLTTLNGRYLYRVSSIDIVQPKDVEVLSPTKIPSLTLVTCYPFHYVGDAPKRYIVSAEMIKAESPEELAAEYSGAK